MDQHLKYYSAYANRTDYTLEHWVSHFQCSHIATRCHIAIEGNPGKQCAVPIRSLDHTNLQIGSIGLLNQ
jgi:hypothetical protein